MYTHENYPNPENEDGVPGRGCLFASLFGLFLWALIILIYKWIRSAS